MRAIRIWACALIAGASLLFPAGGAGAGGTAALTVHDFAFAPATLTIAPGTTVQITNTGQFAHTWSSDPGATQQWDSGSINPGSTYSVTFDQPGRFGFHCNIHTFMTGTIVVTAGAPPTTARKTPTVAAPPTTAPRPPPPAPPTTVTIPPAKAAPITAPVTTAPVRSVTTAVPPTTAAPAPTTRAPVRATAPTNFAPKRVSTPTTIGTAAPVPGPGSSNSLDVYAVGAVIAAIVGALGVYGVRRWRRATG
jgi:plastocyanin